MILEACIENIEEAQFAAKNGFKRVELCSALSEGGLTPSYGLIRMSAKLKNIETHVMIRPRGGDFCYSDKEIEIMKRDIKAVARAKAHGVVFGLLNRDNTLALENQLLISCARELGLQVTIHRAVDLTPDYELALERLISWNTHRVLTAGGGVKAMEGLDQLQRAQERYGDKIDIMAGSGIQANNVRMMRAAGIQQLHFSIGTNDNSNAYSFGGNRIINPEKVDSIKEALGLN